MNSVATQQLESCQSHFSHRSTFDVYMTDFFFERFNINKHLSGLGFSSRASPAALLAKVFDCFYLSNFLVDVNAHYLPDCHVGALCYHLIE